MELLLINHPLDCPVCDKGGECPLQNQAMSNGRADTRFEDVKRTFPKPINISLAGAAGPRTVRAVRAVHPVLRPDRRRPVHRAARTRRAAAGRHRAEEPFDSYFSGNTVQICPVGALTGAAYRFRARPFDLVSSPSVCEHCASGCAQRTDHRRGKVLRRLAGDDPQVNEEWNCDKGRWAFTYAAERRPDHHPADPRRGRQAAAGVVVGGPWPSRRAGLAAADGSAGVLVGGRRDARGRLRLRQVRPDGVGHQRHRLPRPAALRRRRPSSWPHASPASR